MSDDADTVSPHGLAELDSTSDHETAMAVALAPGEVLARSLADCEEHWNAQGTLNPAQRRWRDYERELRTNCAAQGLGVPAADDPTIAAIRSGAKESRDQQSTRKMQHSRERLAMLRKTGHSFDEERRLVAPALTRIHAPARRENATRPRERRPATRRRARAPTNDDPSPLPDLEVRSYARFRRDVRRALGGAA